MYWHVRNDLCMGSSAFWIGDHSNFAQSQSTCFGNDD